MKVLLIDNHRDPKSWGAFPLRRELREAALHLKVDVAIHSRRGPESDFRNLAKDATALVISGSATSCLEQSPWIENQLHLIRRFLEQDQPILGVCFGHQLLARAHWGLDVCRKSALPEKGWITLSKSNSGRQDPLLQALPEQFWSYASHSEEIAADKISTPSLLRSDACANHAFRIPGRRAWGIQFHPEKSPNDLVEEGLDLQHFSSRPPKNLQVYDPKVALQIFSNFLGLLRT